jgi:hypothetical protein
LHLNLQRHEYLKKSFAPNYGLTVLDIKMETNNFVNPKGAFSLARFRTKLARLVMKTIFFVTKRASLMRNRMRKSQM